MAAVKGAGSGSWPAGDTVMPVIFWLAAIDAGKNRALGDDFRRRGAAVIGNAVPGLVLEHPDRQRRVEERLAPRRAK